MTEYQIASSEDMADIRRRAAADGMSFVVSPLIVVSDGSASTVTCPRCGSESAMDLPLRTDGYRYGHVNLACGCFPYGCWAEDAK